MIIVQVQFIFRLGEVCSHVAGILFKIEACVRLEFNKVACTSMPCKWNQNFTQKPALVDDICFSKAKKDQIPAPLPAIPEVTFADTSNLRLKLRNSVPNAVLFSITHPVITDWTQIQNEVLPSPLTVLYDEKNKFLSEQSLQILCENVFSDQLKVTVDEVAALEKATVGQSKSPTWFEHRVGRLTASNFGSIFHCRCKPDQLSLLEKIMQYDQTTDTENNYCRTGMPVSCEWGLKHEKDALKHYQCLMMSSHFNLALSNSGLVVNQDFPHLGATPDSYLSCDCCGRGLVEVKCLYKYKDEHPCKLADQQFFLNPHTMSNPLCSNALKLSHNHYYQIQGQLHVCNLEFCDFVVWSSKGLHVERIFKNKTIWDTLKVKLDFYFLHVVLPELLTRKNDPKMEHACPTPRKKRPRKV
ncbi:uncharacterized protein LOC124271511 isoform X2 [Haliotis rubra]|uniref:uncharacterized protein LOC124271511 isoform X2 n=1 Tax=Haliotis rubra TaxID=36100 RepID=UPI001EE5FC36|nr:uncharacterized protein LOC124271511 isoform X2 [Haliotis rubra]